MLFPVDPGVDLFWVNSGIVFFSFLISAIYRLSSKILRGGGTPKFFKNLPEPTSRDTWNIYKWNFDTREFGDPIPKIDGKRFTCWAIDTFSCKNDSCSGLGYIVLNIYKL